ncbi:hypothetical protein YC2023_026506 [Brassica napus]
MSWNCQGLGNVLTIRRVKELHRTLSPDIMFLMETKNSDEFIKSKLDSIQYPNYFSIPPVGLSGGLTLLWKQGVEIKIIESCAHFIDAEVVFKGTSSFVTFVYGEPVAGNRADFWNTLTRVGANREEAWLLTGDFNDILDNSEKEGGPERWEGSFTAFRSFVSQNGLWNLKHSGNQLSWRGVRYTHHIKSRLDRSLVNCSWSESFPMGRSVYLRYEGSDHRPVITYFNTAMQKRRGLFRFNRSYTENEEVTQLVDAAWNHHPLDSVITKLNSVRRSIIKWAKEQNVKSNLVIQSAQQALEEALSMPVADLPHIQTLTNTLLVAYREEESFWLQRSRIQWLKKGDRNTGFFHAATRKRRALNNLSVIEKENGEEVFEEAQISSVIADYYTEMFTTNSNSDFSLVQACLVNKITPEMNSRLIEIPSDKEIEEAARSINGGKAPGPDGFSAKFYHSYWHIIGKDVITDVRSFFVTGIIHPQQNETHVRLIPKGSGPRKVADYRPIALCNTHYKIIAKILTRRLKPLLPDLISKTQSAFVAGRAISDNVLITHETLHYLRTSEAKKYCSMAVKTDMSKAYDRIEWGFIRAVLAQLGFDPIWVSWILACVESVSYSFLINGSPSGHVTPSRGIRQGDPLSPYLFIMCTEVLSAMCTKAQLNGTMAGVKVARNCPPINHLLFADDTMFFCKSTPACVTTLKTILESYENVSGQRINLLKSSITFSAKTPGEVKARVKTELSIPAEGGIGKYLGLPENFGRKKRDIFAAILDRIRQKAHSWTSRFLSGAGKQVLLKSVLAAIPCYTMSCFKLPISLCKQIQSLLTRFWWDANPEKKKMCWVAWSTLTLPKYAGGLGFKDIETFNDAMLAKIGWRLIQFPDSLLAQVLLGKYAKASSFMECESPSSASHGWRSILAGREVLRKGLGWVVGNGENIKVWGDPWLSSSFPTAPIGPPTENAVSMTVSELLCPLTNAWDIQKIQNYLPQYEGIINRIITSSAPARDSLAWLAEKSGEYTVKTGYGVERVGLIPPHTNEQTFDWLKNIWNLNTSPKIKDFLWKVKRKAIPVSSNLATRGMAPFPCAKCGGVEDDLHVFLLCPFASQSWSLLPVYEIPDGSNSSMASLFANGKKYTNLPPVGCDTPVWPWLLWNLWKARNKLCFENKTFTEWEVVNKSVTDAKEWAAAQLLAEEHNHATKRQGSPPIIPQPSPGQVLCHVDAAWDLRTGNCCIGVLFSELEDTRIQPLKVSRSFVSSALMGEALAVRLAVMTASSSNVRSLIVLSDSQVLINMIRAKESRPELFGILFDIYHFSLSFEDISFHFIPRLCNVAADNVAKAALASVNSTSLVGS